MDPQRTIKPPRLADRLLRKCLPHGMKGLAILGDLREDYHARVAEGRRADWWYWREALLLSFRYMNMTDDFRVAVRSLRHNAASSAIIVLTLGMALGASTIGFSFADLAILRGLPVDDGRRVVQVYAVDPRLANGRGRFSPADFRDMKNRVTTLSRFAAFQNGSATILDRGIPKSLIATRVTSDFFSAMGQKPYLGRLFEDGDDTPGHANTVVLPYHYWQQALASAPDVVGRSIFVDGLDRTIIGVASPDLELGSLAMVDIWLPLEITAAAPRRERTLSTMARLRDGVALETAQAEITAIAKSLAAEYPNDDRGSQAVVMPISAVGFGSSFWIVIGLFVAAVVLIMIIASANAASLILARAMARRREIALRSALGAGRFRLLRQALVEGPCSRCLPLPSPYRLRSSGCAPFARLIQSRRSDSYGSTRTSLALSRSSRWSPRSCFLCCRCWSRFGSISGARFSPVVCARAAGQGGVARFWSRCSCRSR